MSRLALVETRLALHAELGAFHPVEHEQRAFDAPDLAEREIQAVLLAVGAELAQHRRGLYGHGFDTGRQPQGVVPVLEHDLLVDRLAHEGGELLPPPGSAEARQPTIRKVAQTRSKRKAEQVEQGKTWSETPPVSTWCTRGSNRAAYAATSVGTDRCPDRARAALPAPSSSHRRGHR